MSHKVIRYLALSQLSLVVFLGICFALIPRFLLQGNEGGVSNYGVNSTTVLPYSVAFLLSGLLVLKAAYYLPRSTQAFNHFRQLLYTLAALLFLVLVSTYPYKLSVALKDLHIGAAALLFCFETAFSIWLVLVLQEDRTSSLLLTVQMVGFLLAFLSLIKFVHLLFIAQMITGVAFGSSLIYGGWRLVQEPKT